MGLSKKEALNLLNKGHVIAILRKEKQQNLIKHNSPYYFGTIDSEPLVYYFISKGKIVEQKGRKQYYTEDGEMTWADIKEVPDTEIVLWY